MLVRRYLGAIHGERGIAVANLTDANSRVKAITLGADDSHFYQADDDNLINQRYPLTRLAYAYVNRTPGKPMQSSLRQVLEYVLSSKGQQDVVKGGYLPLDAAFLDEQHAKIR